jgi:hypothetical protein
VTAKPETAPLPFGGVFDPLRYNPDIGGLAELADAEVSKTSESNLISVRFRYPPPSGVFPKNQGKKVPQGDHSWPRPILEKSRKNHAGFLILGL